ncbi:MAG: phage minor head protein [Bacteroidales bacterium]|nr:phage minor head protein [Bacteroidales bacterium]
MRTLYGLENTQHSLSETSKESPKFNPSVWKRLAKWMYKKKEYKPEMLSEPEPLEAIKETYRVLNTPLSNLSVKQEIPPELTATLEKNIFYFSGFKTHHELVEASRLLKDDDGNFKPFQRYLKDIEKIDNTYNKQYLRAEYNFATASTQMAVKWKEWEEDGDRYDLQYRTAGDDRVREEHAALDKTTLPPSDPFWDSYLPPNGWNCRCTTVQVRKGKYPRSDSDKAIAAGADCTAKPKQQIFRFNPGKQEKIFPPKHPYYKAPKIVKEVVKKDFNKQLRKYKDDELKEWVKNNIPENGILLKGKQFKNKEIIINRANAKSVCSHFTDPQLKELVKDIKQIVSKCNFKEERPLDPMSHNFDKKVNNKYESFRYYIVQHKGYNIRINASVIEGKEYVYSLNLIIK